MLIDLFVAGAEGRLLARLLEAQDRLARLEAEADCRKARVALADFNANGGTSLEDLKRELDLK